jgi:AcrR family transcriptional regulator
MSPRPYKLGQRRSATEATRARILGATRDLLIGGGGPGVFSIDAVANQAGVARMTVYYQFGSRRGLLEALMDDLAARGGMRKVAEVFHTSDPLEALGVLIKVFVHFWASDRIVTRRLRSFAVLDPEFRHVRARDEWRREHLRNLLKRVIHGQGRRAAQAFEETVDILQTLTSFETFDTLATPTRTEDDVASLIWRLARAELELGAQPVSRSEQTVHSTRARRTLQDVTA